MSNFVLSIPYLESLYSDDAASEAEAIESFTRALGWIDNKLEEHQKHFNVQHDHTTPWSEGFATAVSICYKNRHRRFTG
jgi:2,3-bisphosphoglycerate-independent phosphoglycerate mutase